MTYSLPPFWRTARRDAARSEPCARHALLRTCSATPGVGGGWGRLTGRNNARLKKAKYVILIFSHS